MTRPVSLWLLGLLLALSVGCEEGSPASPTFDNEGGGGEEPEAGYAVCPTGMDASFGSIYSLMLQPGSTSLNGQQSCGANVANNCHSTSGASPATGSGNLLDFSLDAGAVYAELIDHRSANLSGTATIARVDPGDASASMLYVKLTIDASTNALYGAGMPYTDPGSVCPQALETVAAWINQGAPFEPGDAAPQSTDAASDAATDAKPDAEGASDAGPG